MVIAGDIKRYIQGQVTLSGTAAVTLALRVVRQISAGVMI